MNNYMKVIINAMKQWTNDKLSGFDAKFVGIDDALKNKVDSIDGKGLSTNDYTTATYFLNVIKLVSIIIA